MRILVLALSGILLISVSMRPVRCEASDPAVALSQSEGWLRLGHYRKKLLGGAKSLVANDHFFLSPEGRTSPYLELKATIEAFRSASRRQVGVLKQDVECAFPARRSWLIQQGISLPAQVAQCKDRDDWLKGISATGATLVFSSAYPNNPASMFGHTLLMLNHDSKDPILNYGANFEAQVGADDPAPIYAFKGLFGLYPGGYAIAPYYTKINEYNYSESRDLWEYELNLKPEEVSILVNHLWELFSQGGFDYYFLDDNCSYQLLALLEVAKPEWNLTSGFGLYALPLDTIKRVASQAGAIKTERMRASLFRKMNDEESALSPTQKSLRSGILSGRQRIDQVSDISVLESLLTTFDYLRRRKGGKFTEAQERMFQAVLLRRTQLGMTVTPAESLAADKVKEEKIVKEESPLVSHGSHVIYPGFLKRGNLSRLSLGGRIALHELLDPPRGYSEGFSVDVARTRLTLGLEAGDKKLRLDEFQLIDLLSLYPWNSIDPQISWTLRAGAGSRIDFGDRDSLGTLLEGGPGLAARLGDGALWLYSLALFQGEVNPDSPKRGRYGIGGEAGAKASLGSWLQVKATARYRFEFNRPFSRIGFWENAAQAAITVRPNLQWRLGARAAGSTPSREWTSDLRWYF